MAVALPLALTFVLPLCKNPPMSTPYSYPMTDGDNPPISAAPPFRLFDSTSVAIATLLGSPVAGTLLMGINYQRLGKGGKAAAAMVIGLVATIVAIVFGNFVPYTFSSVVAIGLLLTTRSCAQVLQGPAVSEHVAQGGKLGSRWAALGIGVAFLAAIFGAIFLVTFVRQIGHPQTMSENAKVIIGTQDTVYYSGSATQQDAKTVGDKLKEIEYFADRGVTVLLSKEKGHFVVSFVVKEGVWNNSDMVTAFQEIGGELAPVLGTSPIVVRLDDKERNTKKEFNAGKVTIGTKDEIFYSGFATEADAMALGDALKKAGYLEDRGVTILLSKGEGTVLSLVVKEGIWDKPSSVTAYQNLARQVAPSIGGLPLNLRLVNSSLASKREMTIQ
jgi:hypothetical protein